MTRKAARPTADPVVETLREAAPAKVNLCLHVTRRRPDGYHLLDSLVAFTRVGDLVEAEPARGLSLSVGGPFGHDLAVSEDNSVIAAAQAIRPAGRGAALRLTKRLPVASGVGGGSADAAATLRLLGRMWDVSPLDDAGVLRLGADVPACLVSVSCRMAGIGERLTPVALPEFWLVLVNPGIKVSTASVFERLAVRDNAGLPDFEGFQDFGALVAFLITQRNDLENPATEVAPVIGEVLSALRSRADCAVARMSGSGATCFGLFASEAAATEAAETLRRSRPAWWVAATPAP
jgi:4-diphosphocytidyl-2-C-methyl-D-erythritol kinase